MSGGRDTAGQLWLLRVWRQSPPAIILILLVTAGQLVGAENLPLRAWIVGASILVLDLLGAGYSWRAARALPPAGRLPWRLIAAGRASSVLATLSLFASAAGSPVGWWWCGAIARLLMFVLMAGGVLTAGLRQFSGRSRVALIAEVGVVLSAGFMVTWYFALEPILATQSPGYSWLTSIGWPLGDLLLLAAVASVVLRGAVTRFAIPITVFSAGLAVYCAADVAWSASDAAGSDVAANSVAGISIVGAALLLTVAPMFAAKSRTRPVLRRSTAPPAWATHLPTAAMLVSGLLMLIVTLLEGELLPWGGLVVGLIAMTSAAAVRQMVSLRDTQEQVVTDPLTRLANRAGLDQALDRSARRGECVAVLLIDLDGFKLVNDAYGHAAGDVFLVHVAHRLRAEVRDGNTAARIGGDEFVVLLPGIATLEYADGVAARLLAALAAHPVRLDDDVVPVRASIGVAFAEPGEDGKTLLRHADVAMYQSKRAGSHSHTVYTPALVDRRAADAALGEDLEHAVRRNELFLLYQPLVDLSSNRPIAAEALLRWNHPIHGVVSPVQFIQGDCVVG